MTSIRHHTDEPSNDHESNQEVSTTSSSSSSLRPQHEEKTEITNKTDPPADKPAPSHHDHHAHPPRDPPSGAGPAESTSSYPEPYSKVSSLLRYIVLVCSCVRRCILPKVVRTLVRATDGPRDVVASIAAVQIALACARR